LAKFLITQTDIIENADEEDKKRSLVYNKIPHEVVKDPSGLARELLWRVKRELGDGADQVAISDAPALPISKQAASKPKPRKDLRNPRVSRTVDYEPM
jgi:F-box/leucine-rich repeat protein 10/11